MKKWSCVECGKQELTIRLDETRIYLECDACADTKWIKR